MEFTKNEIDRFFSKIKKLDNNCWEWTSGKYCTGYGMFCARRGKRKTFLAHRISWMIYNNASILNRVMVCHTCDNRLCVNPEHLYLGTGFDNNRDTIERNRGNRLRGSKCSWARLTDADVIEIRRLKALGVRQREIARKYDFDQASISNIVNYKNWKHIS